jgi:hypothetical protein
VLCHVPMRGWCWSTGAGQRRLPAHLDEGRHVAGNCGDVRDETRQLSFSGNSLAILFSPHSGFSVAKRRMSWHNSGGIGGRHGRDSQSVRASRYDSLCSGHAGNTTPTFSSAGGVVRLSSVEWLQARERKTTWRYTRSEGRYEHPCGIVQGE